MAQTTNRTGRGSGWLIPALQVTAILSGVLVAAGSQLVHGQTQDQSDSALSQTPLFVSQALAPLNMLVLGRDHKLYYEAYNDASDLNGDGVIDVGYKPDSIDYYGYFNNKACYSYDGTDFKPVEPAVGDKLKKCAGNKYWSGDFLNYLGTSRMDAIRRVLYGGTRVVDTKGDSTTGARTVLQAAYIPRDAHTWGKAYDPVRDYNVYNIADYAPLAQPKFGTRHLFAVTTLGESATDYTKLRVLNDSRFQIWNWVSQEGKAGQSNCTDSSTQCAKSGSSSTYEMVPSSMFRNLKISTYKNNSALGMPGDTAAMGNLFTQVATSANLCGTGDIVDINTTGKNNNPFAGKNGCTNENYITVITGEINIPATSLTFGIDGDDAVDVTIGATLPLGWYGSHSQGTRPANFASTTNKNQRPFTFDSIGWKSITFRHVEGTGDDAWGLAMQVEQPASSITDYNLRVEVCSSANAALREDSCKPYGNNGGNVIYKPTGLLHDFGENEKMYFGLLTGSYSKNIAGGTLRRNIGNFADEVDAQTGQFKSDVKGVVYNIDHQRLIGFNGTNYQGTYDCGWITTSSISKLNDPSRCTMWGNPIAEMMFETTRYFAGASGAHSTYDYGSGSSKDATLELSKPAWVSPYKPKADGGAGYQHCAKPVMTVISDINPSYDSKVPGSSFGDSIAASASLLSGFDVSKEVNAIGDAEGISGKKFFIGESPKGSYDGAPSEKTISKLAEARGLSPQEPSKEGTYYSAGVARFAAQNAIFGNASDNKSNSGLMTYSVAIASPLPEIRFPVGSGKFITIAPFAKSVSGGAGGNNFDNTKFTATNQIVDYYVDTIANTGAADANPDINGGRAYAEFRINYEDVEQGADHDMDAIARYKVTLQADNTVKIDMISEYAAGSIGQHMGYAISGTTADGMYLEVRDKDTSSVFYELNTPPGRAPGYCKGSLSSDRKTECTTLGLSATRTFTPGTEANSASFLKGPLWYAAKYGMPGRDASGITGDPDNYFLVTNATTLKDQMTKAFNSILQNTTSVTAANVSLTTSELSNGASIYSTSFEAKFWSGDVVRKDTVNGVKTTKWSAAQVLSQTAVADRKIYYASQNALGKSTLNDFTYDAISGRASDASWITALNINPVTGVADGQAAERISFLRGTTNIAMRERNPLGDGKYNVLGDIVNSSLVRVSGGQYRASAADKLEGTTKYAAFAANQATKETLYVGSNDGMLHAFEVDSGKEEFAFIPSSVKTSLNVLTSANYGTSKGLAHRYYVDGTPVVTDVYFDGDWHKVLIGSMAAGGKQIFALDVTDPAAPKLLWEFGVAQSGDVGYSVPQPTVARLNDAGGTPGKWVVLLPNGYQGLNSSAGNASMFVLDVSNGQVIRKFDLPGGMSTAEVTASKPLGNGLSRVAAIDNDSDGKVDLAYAGDLAGNVWRFDLTSGSSTAWTAQLFFTARDKATPSQRQPITAAPYVVKHPSGTGDLVIFGTGRFLASADKQSVQNQTVYGVWDRHSTKGTTAPATLPTANKGRSNLHQQTFTSLPDTSDPSKASGNFKLTGDAVTWYNSGSGTADANVAKWGWYVDLPRNGEKLVYDMSLYGKSLIFTTIRTAEDPCKADIAGTIYAIDPNDGGKTDYTAFDMNNDGKFDAADQQNDNDVNGAEIDPGKVTLGAGKAITPVGEGSLGVNDGLDRGRQSWRRQPS